MGERIYEVRETESFSIWLSSLQDPRARAKIASRIDRLARGNSGDAEPVGEGVSEMRVHYGPGYRVYYTKVGQVIVLLLCGGNKKTQTSDIKIVKALRRRLP